MTTSIAGCNEFYMDDKKFLDTFLKFILMVTGFFIVLIIISPFLLYLIKVSADQYNQIYFMIKHEGDGIIRIKEKDYKLIEYDMNKDIYYINEKQFKLERINETVGN